MYCCGVCLKKETRRVGVRADIRNGCLSTTKLEHEQCIRRPSVVVHSDNGTLNINSIATLLLSWRRNTPHPAQLIESLGSLTCHKIPPQISVRRLNPVYSLWPYRLKSISILSFSLLYQADPFPSYFAHQIPVCISFWLMPQYISLQSVDHFPSIRWYCWPSFILLILWSSRFLHRVLGVFRRLGWASFIFQPNPSVLQPSSVFRPPDLKVITTHKVIVRTVHVNIYTWFFFTLNYEFTLPECSINAVSKNGRLYSRKTGIRFVHVT